MALDHTHPDRITGAVTRVRAELAGVADAQPAFLKTEDREALLTELVAAEAQLTELRMRVLSASGDVADLHGARDVAGWVASRSNVQARRLRAEAELAAAAERWPGVTAAMATGRLTPDQARVVVRGLDALPDHLEAAVRERAHCDLVAYGTGDHSDAPDTGFGPRELGVLADRILHVVAPEVADEEDARHLERLEHDAHRKTTVRIRGLGDGMSRVIATVPDHIATRLVTYLDAYTSPRHAGAHTREQNPDLERLPRARALGHAFCALLEHLDPASLPDHGGDATTLVVTIDHDHLTRSLGVAELLDAGDTDQSGRISAAQARRLACTAKILPAVLGGKSEVLDLGRAQRLFSPAQRKALRLRDRTCRAEGCTVPATWCEAHHLDPWSRGGRTDLADGVLLCNFHHHREHDPGYVTTRLPNGAHRYHRRT
ncbi:HNH endonuclease signature motif containing protein [Nocardioides sambongensis]|uniref:HNH endonuclease signature motif containing protein n=1 Tax=Nocardioides sambongensis TaxID=2589074 RepID=UPI00112AE6FD|nr:HNH endonuclease signature motif containing protein [Nocardioides sambongensis]